MTTLLLLGLLAASQGIAAIRIWRRKIHTFQHNGLAKPRLLLHCAIGSLIGGAVWVNTYGSVKGQQESSVSESLIALVLMGVGTSLIPSWFMQVGLDLLASYLKETIRNNKGTCYLLTKVQCPLFPFQASRMTMKQALVLSVGSLIFLLAMTMWWFVVRD